MGALPRPFDFRQAFVCLFHCLGAAQARKECKTHAFNRLLKKKPRQQALHNQWIGTLGPEALIA
jgi:hypothetical protein